MVLLAFSKSVRPFRRSLFFVVTETFCTKLRRMHNVKREQRGEEDLFVWDNGMGGLEEKSNRRRESPPAYGANFIKKRT